MREGWSEHLWSLSHTLSSLTLGSRPLARRRYEGQARRKGPWCVDFLRGGQQGLGSCCAKDETMRRWCDAPGRRAAHAALWQEACNASSPQFGLRSLVLKGAQTRNARTRPRV